MWVVLFVREGCLFGEVSGFEKLESLYFGEVWICLFEEDRRLRVIVGLEMLIDLKILVLWRTWD